MSAEQGLVIWTTSSQGVEANLALCKVDFGTYQALAPDRRDGKGIRPFSRFQSQATVRRELAEGIPFASPPEGPCGVPSLQELRIGGGLVGGNRRGSETSISEPLLLTT